ncbi:benzoate 4-monooxygenase cytochrome p450 [Grosmannia clavigera kw1407]|uniref:Benzoate 4-monooxygenase cytochrome p450 n=1 Tax=Grosmannia clavigera (strain kw1407 / UAMH 11150) TaxID=655863 RepID=F0XMP3_GROCL|nr:benzoate 4-monooxygenase cytochrome p450 [Grosmannia clavigera kw1407]EFX01545.1 benzoate 4-monooxygenase cytochrome p450 [Grosmannia clavigera kw1407]
MSALLWHGAQAAWARLPGSDRIPVVLVIPAILTAAAVLSTVSLCIYRLWFHPLARVPGPWLAACSSFWLAWHSFVGDECTAVFRLHEKYGPVLRVGPNDVDIADADAVNPIYVERGGFAKTANYSKFDVDGHATLFSSLTRDSRLPRARAVAPLFATGTIRKASGVGDNAVAMIVERFVECVKLHADHSRATGRPVNALLLGRSLALDAVSTHLFKQTYGALAEENMSAAPFVDAFVGVGAFFNLHAWLPGWDMKLMDLIDRFTGTMVTPDTDGSMQKIDEYTIGLVETAVPGSGSYASRLLAAGTKTRQVQAECKDVCFAGTDSSGMNMAMMLWQLSRHPDVYARLQRELAAQVEANGPATDITTNSYLRGVVRESLRLSWAAPTRLPRIVPAGGKTESAGWAFGGYVFPPGTSVGVASFQLHQDEAVFPEATAFRPERWLQPTERMLNSFFAFGKGGRACIGQNLAMSEMLLGTARLAQSDALRGATTVRDHVDILEWFNSRVIGEEVLLTFS